MSNFWSTQPVFGENDTSCTVNPKEQLPSGFSWGMCTKEEAQVFLLSHYVNTGTFKLAYALKTLEWASTRLVAIRTTGNDIAGIIASSPLRYRVYTTEMDMSQINFLCVHSQYRNRELAPFLIKEITRLSNIDGIWQAIYTTQSKIPTPITKSDYWHRFLDVKKLVDLGFHKTNRLRENYYNVRGPCIRSWREMTEADIEKVTRILKGYTQKFDIAPVIDEDYVRRWVLPTRAYIADDGEEFISFYDIPYERVDGGGTVQQAYRFWIVGDVWNDAFLIAKNLGFHVFNTLGVGVDTENLERLKFMKGTGGLYYYLYNWNLSDAILPKDLHVIIP